MTLKNIVKSAIVIEWLLFPLYLLLDSLLNEKLPEVLQKYLLWEAERVSTITDTLVITIAGVLLILYLASSIGVFLFKAWAKKTYIIVTLSLIFTTTLMGPSVEHEILAALDEIASVLSGMILALLLFTNVYAENSPGISKST